MVIAKIDPKGENNIIEYDGREVELRGEATLRKIAYVAVSLGATSKTKIRYEIRG